MRTIGVVTVARSDYGIYYPILQKIRTDAELDLLLYVSGMHLSPEFEYTAKAIQEDGFEISEWIEMLVSSDRPQGIAKSIGLGVIGFAQVFSRQQPDILLVLGDRFEMFAAALAALPFKIPIAHIHGGEVTEGAIDDALRHSITKLSHLHFVSTEQSTQRVLQLGEEPWRITISGAPSLDNLDSMELLSRAQIEELCQLDLSESPLLVTFHPVTLEYEQTQWQVGELLAALDQCDKLVIFTSPNADTGNRMILPMLEQYVKTHTKSALIRNLGTRGYFSLMAFALAMVGNSSSGLIEAPTFHLPVVNIGTRQMGRVRAENVIDVGYARGEILVGIQSALAPAFRQRLAVISNPYRSGNASERIVKRLKEVELNDRLVRKKFCDLSWKNDGRN